MVTSMKKDKMILGPTHQHCEYIAHTTGYKWGKIMVLLQHEYILSADFVHLVEPK
jgi:hypothetical protein